MDLLIGSAGSDEHVCNMNILWHTANTCTTKKEDAQYAGNTWACIVVLRTDMASLKRRLMQRNSGGLGLVDWHLGSYQCDSGSNLDMDDHCVLPGPAGGKASEEIFTPSKSSKG